MTPATVRYPAPHAQGFSLVEMLVALAVTGLAAVLLAGAIGQLGGSARRGTARAEAEADVLRASGLLRTQLMRAVPQADPQNPGGAVLWTGGSATLDWIGPPLDRAAPDALWAYRLARGSDGALTLYHRSTLDPAAGDRSPGTRDWQALPLLADTAALELAYFGADASGLRRWDARWSSRPGLPLLVRVTVRFDDGDARVWPDLVVRPRASGNAPCPADVPAERCGAPA